MSAPSGRTQSIGMAHEQGDSCDDQRDHSSQYSAQMFASVVNHRKTKGKSTKTTTVKSASRHDLDRRLLLFAWALLVGAMCLALTQQFASGSFELNPSKLRDYLSPVYNLYPDAYLDPVSITSISVASFETETNPRIINSQDSSDLGVSRRRRTMLSPRTIMCSQFIASSTQQFLKS